MIVGLRLAFVIWKIGITFFITYFYQRFICQLGVLSKGYKYNSEVTHFVGHFSKITEIYKYLYRE